MSGWTIAIPHKSLDESLVNVAAHCRHLPEPVDAQVQRQIVLQARLDGVATSAGELIDHVNSLSREQRRKTIDRARVELGLPSTEEVEAGERIIHIGTSGLSAFPVLERELPPHLRGIGLGE